MSDFNFYDACRRLEALGAEMMANGCAMYAVATDGAHCSAFMKGNTKQMTRGMVEAFSEVNEAKNMAKLAICLSDYREQN